QTLYLSTLHRILINTKIYNSQTTAHFFIYQYGDQRDLHSFPTRRSSDLAENTLVTKPLGTPGFARAKTGMHGALIRWPAAEPARSEEHTSELQSRENLVCRLLLEKKKEYDIQRHTPSRLCGTRH